MTDYPREPRRRAEFMFPPNTLKAKVGHGGIDERLLEKAQKVIDDTKVDFLPIGQRYLASLQEGISTIQVNRGRMDDENLIAAMLYPAVQLKANGAMFRYPLVTKIAARLIRFLEQIESPNDDALAVATGFADTLAAILLINEGGKKRIQEGDNLFAALDDACTRYFEKHGH